MLACKGKGAEGEEENMFFNHGIHRMMVSLVLLFGVAVAAVAAEPGITVEARQRYPWNGLVDLKFTITGESSTKYDTSFTAKDMVGGTNIAMKTIRKSNGVAAEEKEKLLPGTYNWIWDAAADLPNDFKCERMTVTGNAEQSQGLYMVIDLSSGPNSSKYPVSYLDAVPSGGWSDEYKTTKLVLRKIEPGSFMMEGKYNIILTKAFYIGIFEFTQKQYMLVTGNNPSEHVGDKRPVEYVSYNSLRGTSKEAIWPTSDNVDSTSFMGKFRSRTGLSFDLPTQSQWEYACRAGTTSDFNNGLSYDTSCALGRYLENQSTVVNGAYVGGYGSAHTTVGSYLPNNWGLYDMHGNVLEKCLDWSGPLETNTDPKGASSGSARVVRGGAWNLNMWMCSSSISWGMPPDEVNTYIGNWHCRCGFRICMIVK